MRYKEAHYLSKISNGKYQITLIKLTSTNKKEDFHMTLIKLLSTNKKEYFHSNRESITTVS